MLILHCVWLSFILQGTVNSNYQLLTSTFHSFLMSSKMNNWMSRSAFGITNLCRLKLATLILNSLIGLMQILSLIKFARLLKLFNDSLARTDLYIRLNRSDLFPLMFYQIRWVEGEPWQFIVTVVTQYLPLSNPKHPKNKSYDLLV